ncbi:hypothetical protein NG798_23775 [Ancylothrix sp. C2]|uniref:hypothetical protein n=1 Tax=Ancylothrix sp. D3o TaxID=2953691 RepID=UPI0021BB93D3|nr:hypothetical protein [Ancylothrix sp. D3o]MCT7952824.1 hypothetical protein [Ancylothrix sp. D3o]
MAKQRYWKILIAAATSLMLTLVAGGVVPLSGTNNTPPVFAQRIPLQNAAEQVYKLLPDLPTENNYTNRQSGQIDKTNTLASRFIRYHLFIKGRPAIYRLDWKHTLADYLGVNERIEKSLYPGHDTLRENPIEGDIAAISKLNRAQREILVNTLVGIYSPKTTQTPAPTPSTNQPAPPPTPTPPVAPPGTGSDLLK